MVVVVGEEGRKSWFGKREREGEEDAECGCGKR